IAHILFGEAGAILPGMVSAMSDSHSTSGGVFNAFATPIGDEIDFVLATGELWLQVPQSIRIHLSGELPRDCFGKDAALSLLRDKGSAFAIYRVLEFGGPGLGSLSIEDRWTLSNMAIEMGAK